MGEMENNNTMSASERAKQLIAEKAYNQCSVTIRCEGDEIEIPIDFGLTAAEIKQIYPFMLPIFGKKVKNPAIEFESNSKKGLYKDVPEEEYQEILDNVHRQSRYWYDKPEASVLELAVRFAVDIQLAKFDDLVRLFYPADRPESVKPMKMSDAEVEKVIEDMKLESPVDFEHDAGDEKDVPAGVGGGYSVNIYDSSIADDKYTQELDDMERKLVNDEIIDKMLNDDVDNIDVDKYKSEYKPSRFSEDEIKDGQLINIYEEEDKQDAEAEKPEDSKEDNGDDEFTPFDDEPSDDDLFGDDNDDDDDINPEDYEIPEDDYLDGPEDEDEE